MCILLKVKKHEKTFALNVDIFNFVIFLTKTLQNRFHYVKMETVK